MAYLIRINEDLIGTMPRSGRHSRCRLSNLIICKMYDAYTGTSPLLVDQPTLFRATVCFLEQLAIILLLIRLLT